MRNPKNPNPQAAPQVKPQRAVVPQTKDFEQATVVREVRWPAGHKETPEDPTLIADRVMTFGTPVDVETPPLVTGPFKDANGVRWPAGHKPTEPEPEMPNSAEESPSMHGSVAVPDSELSPFPGVGTALGEDDATTPDPEKESLVQVLSLASELAARLSEAQCSEVQKLAAALVLTEWTKRARRGAAQEVVQEAFNLKQKALEKEANI